MAITGMGFGVRNKKTKTASILSCFRLVLDYPILLAMFIFFACLYRVSPLLFSLIVSASPVVICTAALLGTLLTLGQSKGVTKDGGFRPGQQMPPPVKTRIFDPMTATSFERDNNIAKIKFAEVRKDIIERDIGLVNSCSPRMMSPLSQGQNPSSPTKIEKKPVQEVVNGAGGYQSSKLKPQLQDDGRLESGLSSASEFETECLRPHYWKLQDEISEGENDNRPTEESVNNRSEMDDRSLESKKKVDGRYNNSSDSDSDGGDASVADIIPTVNENEIRPLLGSHDNRQASSPRGKIVSVKSNASIAGPGDEAYYRVDEVDDEDESEEENQGVEEDGSKSVISWTEDDQDNVRDLSSSELERNQQLEKLIARRGHGRRDQDATDQDEESNEEVDENDDDDDDDEEEESLMVEKDGIKDVITWTEDDEKNLKDLGTLELERNQRLEHLLAKRRAMRNFTMIPERNLIDLENFDLPFQVAPISTNRSNPFDVPINPNQQQQGSVPIPGSAPSAIVKRRNPFDSPDHSPKERSSFLADSLRHNFSTVNQHVEKEKPNQQVGLGSGMGPEMVLGMRSSSSAYQNKTSNIMVEDSRPEFMGVNKIEKPPIGPASFRQDFCGMNPKEASIRRHQSFSRGPNFIPPGEAFMQESPEAKPKDSVFRRYQSFSTGPSFFGPPREDGIDLLLRPYFVPEEMAHQEDVSHPITLERQPTDQDAESLSSSSSDDTATESTAVIIDEEEDVNQKMKEAESESEHGHASDHAEEESHSSETETEHHPDQDDNMSKADITMGESKGMESGHEPESRVGKDGEFDASRDLRTDDSNNVEIESAAEQMKEAAEKEDDTTSSSSGTDSSSCAEEDEKSVSMEDQKNRNHVDESGDGIPTMASGAGPSHKEDDHIRPEPFSDDASGPGHTHNQDDDIHPEPVSDDASGPGHTHNEDDHIHPEPVSVDASGPGHTYKEDDHIHPEPVYDTSPSGVVKIIPFISNDVHPADGDVEHDSGDVAVVT